MSSPSVYLKILLALIGTVAIILGEMDDSPGLQGIGLLMIIATIYKMVTKKRDRN